MNVIQNVVILICTFNKYEIEIEIFQESNSLSLPYSKILLKCVSGPKLNFNTTILEVSKINGPNFSQFSYINNEIFIIGQK